MQSAAIGTVRNRPGPPGSGRPGRIRPLVRAQISLCSAVILFAGAAWADTPPPPPVFVDATHVAGIATDYRGGSDWVVGGGAAAFDCSGDGRPELFLAGAEAPARLWRNRSTPGAAPSFEEAPLPGAPLLRATGAYPGDFDGDGILDLVVLRFGGNLLLRGTGDCRFEAQALPGTGDWTVAFAATWERGADRPTLFFGNYVQRDRPLEKTGNCAPNHLLRPSGPVELPAACTLSAMFLDWSGTGWRDLRLANDREYFDRGTSDQIWRLAEGVTELGREAGWDRPVLWGMGIAAEDIDGDLLPEVYVTNMADNRLERLRPGPRVVNLSRQSGVNSQRPAFGPDIRPSTSWHVDMGDLDNDGFLDIRVTKGNVDEMPGFAAFDPEALLMGGPDGRFADRSWEAGLALPGRGRGGAMADFDGDGRLDLVTVLRNAPARLMMNRGPAGNWLAVELAQPGPNRFAVDARVELRLGDRVLSRTRRIGGGHASGTHLPLHFGLGSATGAELRVVWPDGTATDWMRLPAGRVHLIERKDPA